MQSLPIYMYIHRQKEALSMSGYLHVERDVINMQRHRSTRNKSERERQGRI